MDSEEFTVAFITMVLLGVISVGLFDMVMLVPEVSAMLYFNPAFYTECLTYIVMTYIIIDASNVEAGLIIMWVLLVGLLVGEVVYWTVTTDPWMIEYFGIQWLFHIYLFHPYTSAFALSLFVSTLTGAVIHMNNGSDYYTIVGNDKR